MSDVMFLLITAGFFGLAWALALGCERLVGESGDLAGAELPAESDAPRPVTP